jgi:hypothetical protein
MFALIETNGATHIAIHVPGNAAAQSLPKLAQMLESNATFINKGYSDIRTVTPSMSIVLGKTIKVEGYEAELIVQEHGEVIGDEFVPATSDVLVSNAKAIKRRDEELSTLRAKLAVAQSEIEQLKARISEVVAEAD